MDLFGNFYSFYVWEKEYPFDPVLSTHSILNLPKKDPNNHREIRSNNSPYCKIFIIHRIIKLSSRKLKTDRRNNHSPNNENHNKFMHVMSSQRSSAPISYNGPNNSPSAIRIIISKRRKLKIWSIHIGIYRSGLICAHFQAEIIGFTRSLSRKSTNA